LTWYCPSHIIGLFVATGGIGVAKKNKTSAIGREEALDIDHIKRRLDMLDQRLDNIDSVVSAVVERVMNQPIALNLTCSHCGKDTEIALIGGEKPKV